MADMYASKKLVSAADDYLARDVFSVVRDSRMWCPNDIERDSWVSGEQETPEMMNSPHEVDDEGLTDRSPVVRRKRGGPWVR